MSKRCCSTDLLTPVFLFSPRKVISAWQLTPCLFWLHIDDPYMVFLLQNWATLLVPTAASEECCSIKSSAEIMLPGFGAPKPKYTSITTSFSWNIWVHVKLHKEKTAATCFNSNLSLSEISASGILLEYWNDYHLSATINKNILLLHIA